MIFLQDLNHLINARLHSPNDHHRIVPPIKASSVWKIDKNSNIGIRQHYNQNLMFQVIACLLVKRARTKIHLQWNIKHTFLDVTISPLSFSDWRNNKRSSIIRAMMHVYYNRGAKTRDMFLKQTSGCKILRHVVA